MQRILSAEPWVDALRMKEVLKDVADQRGKIARLLESGELIQLRRGLYTTHRDLDPYGVAGPIYGPSYISYESALSWHGMIPERVTEILSATPRRPAEFSNVFGAYRYFTVPKAVYSVGIQRTQSCDVPFLIASPAKALADRIAREPGFRSLTDVRRWLDDMRIEIEQPLDRLELTLCADAYRRPSVRLLARFAEKNDLLSP